MFKTENKSTHNKDNGYIHLCNQDIMSQTLPQPVHKSMCNELLLQARLFLVIVSEMTNGKK